MPYCILCKTYFLKFSEFNKRPGVGCPNCNSAERHRLFGFFYDKYNNDKHTLNILHFAPENCIYNLLKNTCMKYICCDINPNDYPNKDCIKIDATQIDFPDKSFDMIIASHILEHIPNDIGAIKEFNRILTKGGKLIIMIPQNLWSNNTDEDLSINDPNIRKTKYGQSDHVRLYGLDFTERVKNCGFTIKAYVPHNLKNISSMMKLDSTIILGDDKMSRDNGFSQYDILYECIKS